MKWIKDPALLVTIALFVVAQWDKTATFLENNDWAWHLYVALTGIVLFIEKQIGWQFEGYYHVIYLFALHYAFFLALFKAVSIATKPIRWAISILFIVIGLTLYWTQVSG